MGKVGLRDHILALFREKDLRDQQRFDAQTTAINAAMSAADKAAVKAEVATEKRLEGMNEFRQTLSDQAATFVTLAEFNSLKERMDRGDGKSSGTGDVLRSLPVIIGVLVAAGGLAVAYFK